MAKSPLHAAAKSRAGEYSVCCVPLRSAFGVQNLRRRALHASVRAEHAAVAGLGAQHLVAARALMSQECHHGGHHHFPLRSAYWAGQDRNLDGSASHAAVDPRQENVSGAPLNPLWQHGVNHALHHAKYCRRRARFRRLSLAAGLVVRCFRLIPDRRSACAKSRTTAPATARRFGLRNARPAEADHASGCALTHRCPRSAPHRQLSVFFFCALAIPGESR